MAKRVTRGLSSKMFRTNLQHMLSEQQFANQQH
jgi:hypothetical protein